MQPVPTKTESELVNQVARLTQSKRTDVIKNALAVYNWSVRHATTGARPHPTGEEVELETPELVSLEAQGHRLCPEELGLLAKMLANAKSADSARGVPAPPRSHSEP